MKSIYLGLFPLVCFIFASLGFQCPSTQTQSTPSEQVVLLRVIQGSQAEAEFYIPSLTCSHCEMMVQKSLKSIEGVLEVHPNHRTKSVLVQYNPQQTSIEAIHAKLDAMYNKG